MNILLIEDNEDKRNSILSYITELLIDNPYNITEAGDLGTARRKIIEDLYDLIILDVYLPINNGNIPEDVSNELLSELMRSKNYQSHCIALTKYEFREIENIDFFNETGTTVVNYNEDNCKWKVSLENIINKIQSKVKFDFIIFCALNEEKTAYSQADCIIGDLKDYYGFNCQEFIINEHRGLCIVPPRMGPIHMAITVSKALEYFTPKIVSMSGICAGIKSNASMLDIIIGDPCWDYQTGKTKDDGFKPELYQIQLDPSLKLELQQFIEKEENIALIKSKLYVSELRESKIILAPIVTGSAVVANSSSIEEVLEQHRKIAGLEMEMSALYESSFQSLSKPLFFGAKTVVDFGDGEKGDDFHLPGAIISARLVVEFLKYKLNKLD